MTAAGGEGEEHALPVQTDEQFLHTVATENVIEADAALWSTFEQFLDADPSGAWVLAEVTHRPAQKLDAEGEPTGEWELVSTGTWKRDPNVPSPVREVVLAETLDEEG